MSQSLKELVFGKSKQPEALSPDDEDIDIRIRHPVVGTPGSGKTAWVAGLMIMAQTLSADIPNFLCRALPGSSDIFHAASALRRGRFPLKTDPFTPQKAQSGLLISLPGAGLLRSASGWGFSSLFKTNRKVHIPIRDYSGEDTLMMLRKIRERTTLTAELRRANEQAIAYIKGSAGLILVVPASRALIHLEDEQLEREPTIRLNAQKVMAVVDKVIDPDPVLTDILSEWITYKDKVREKVEIITVVVSKWDMLAPFALDLDMDVETEHGMDNFMTNAFPGTMMQLKSLGLHRIKFFPSYFKTMREDGKEVEWSDGGGKRVLMFNEEPENRDKPYRRVPVMPEMSYLKVFDHLASVAR